MIDIDALLKSVGHNMRSLRAYHETSLAGLGEKMNLSHATLSKIEGGKHKSVSLATLATFCNVYGLSLAEILRLEGPDPIAFTQKGMDAGNPSLLTGPMAVICADGYLRALELAYEQINLLKEILAQNGIISKEIITHKRPHETGFA
ncbi:Helix-turn-helix domain-containing protein [Arachidicoccus rhizosphaerae]|uniref:Helix-turn-helix domain-containing protein n=1 Tax=Arachidicoccus rhizosphaerae TaxID=551991 RepID=A0A1H4BNK0_9BACT|nr:helix-turn-helix transcriptional regulator [Arachidicoccus rhizosphaerae]SEA49638.1 Helix-turn-helix domain-containing protein [Arachidicoccus rhizosphaerae]